jgi:trimethylamine---corrinoid protein Co-methyltransferase
MAHFSTLRVLDDAEVGAIHDSSLQVLERVGVRVPHADMRARFAEAGAAVDRTGGPVRIPPALVERCLRTAGRRFVLRGRDHSRTARFGFGERNYNSIAGEALWLDHATATRRPPRLADVATAARVSDALPRITIPGAMADPADVPVPVRCVEVARELIRGTGKPVTFWFHDRASAAFLVELAVAVAGSEAEARASPPFYPFLEPVSPLSFSANGIDLLYETARIPLPVPIGPMAQVGATGPGTLAGTLVQENAEILAGLCVVELIRPGTPVCYGGIPHAHDMRTSQLVFSGPEQSLMAVAMTEMGRHYGLPVYINVGLTDSKALDAQAGLEIGASLLPGMLAGADIFGHMGIAGVDQAASLDMLVLQHEAIDYLERSVRGFEVSPETLAVDVIAQTGPGGAYLAHEHTVRHFREELWFPRILDRQYFDNWDREGRKETAQRARALLDGILAAHASPPVEPALEREMERIVASARRALL